jgi:hypothetical protein
MFPIANTETTFLVMQQMLSSTDVIAQDRTLVISPLQLWLMEGRLLYLCAFSSLVPHIVRQ